MTIQTQTYPVSENVFRQVYDSPVCTASKCGTLFENLRSFKCYNWAYAMPALLKVLEQMEVAA